jgi:hypothetical protein
LKIGIIEIMPLGHYTLVDSVARIYGSDPANEIYIFTQKKGFEVLSPIINEIKAKVEIIFKKEDETVEEFLGKIKGFHPDRVYIITLERYFREIIRADFSCPIHLFIHNIEDWFRLSPGILIYRFFAKIYLLKIILYNVKICFIYPFYKKRIINKTFKSGGKFVVLNKILKKELETYVSAEKLEVIPFSVYKPSIKREFKHSLPVRLCIPGMVDSERRDYYSLFKALEEEIGFFRNTIELDLLGGIAYNIGGDKIIQEADRLIKKGLKINYYPVSLVPLKEFDEQLSKADIIVGNMNVEINKFSTYGKTKDSGIIFTMIRVAKPGMLPGNYALIDELKTSSLIFADYREFARQVKRLVSEPEFLKNLTLAAEKNSLHFEPSKLLKSLI